MMQKAIIDHLQRSATGGISFMSVPVDKYPIVSEFGIAISSLINSDITSSSTKCFGFLNQKCEFVPTENLSEFQSLEEREEVKKFIKARRSTDLSSKNSGPQIIPTHAQSKNTVTIRLLDQLYAKQHIAFLCAVECNEKTLRVESFETERDANQWYYAYDINNSVNTDDADNVVSKKPEVVVKKFVTTYSLSISLKSLKKYRILFLDKQGGEQGEVVVSYVIESHLELKPMMSCYKEFDHYGQALTEDRIEDDDRFSERYSPTLVVTRACSLTSFKSSEEVSEVIQQSASLKDVRRGSVAFSAVSRKEQSEILRIGAKLTADSEDTLASISRAASSKRSGDDGDSFKTIEEIWSLRNGVLRDLIDRNNGIFCSNGGDVMVLFVSLGAKEKLRQSQKKQLRVQFSMDSLMLQSRLPAKESILEFRSKKGLGGGLGL